MTNRPIDRAPQPKRHVGPYYGHGLRRVIEPEVTDPGLIERLSDYWAELADSPAFWRVLAVGIVLSIFAAGLIVTVAAEPLRFEFAETPQPAPTLGVKGISIPLGPSPVEVERRCSVPGEMEQCEYYCQTIDRKRRPEPGWDPYAPIWLRSLAPSNPWTLQQAVLSCDVRTIDGVMTLECRCFDPGTRT